MKKPKQPVTVRLDEETHDRLRVMAKSGTTVSGLISQAIAEFLDGKLNITQEEYPAIDVEEIKAVIPVLEALGKPVHIKLFFELIETQQGR